MIRPPFTSLAAVYDAIMADVEYHRWIDFVLREIGARGWRTGSVLDLGCGTGNVTIEFADRGFETVGIDLSEEMLAVARAKDPGLEWVAADFREFRLGRTFALVVSVFDTLNNIIDTEGFVATAENALAHLDSDGFFVFDVNTSAGLRNLWEDGRAEGWADEVYYRWLHSFDDESGLARVEAYCRAGGNSFTEVHFERPYDPPEIDLLLRRAGFGWIEVVTYPDGAPAGADAERVWVIASRAAPASQQTYEASPARPVPGPPAPRC